MRHSLLTALTTVAVAAAGLAEPVGAQLTLSSPVCTTGIGDFSPVPNATPQCLGSFEGNDQNQLAGVTSAITTAWGGGFAYMGASDDPDFGPFTSNPEFVTGTLTFDSPLSGDFALILKAGDQFSIFGFLGMVDLASIDFTTAGVNTNGSAPNALSHGSLWGRNVSVPEPGTALLMLTGLVGIAVARRRREGRELDA